jgi:cytochrome c553
MRTLAPALLSASALLATACVGDLPSGPADDGEPIPPPSATAREIFDDKVSPKLESTCAACHAGQGAPTKFLGLAGRADNYDTLTVSATLTGGWDPDVALLLTHRHTGGEPELDATAKAGVREWLLKEAEDRADDPPMQTPRDALAKWSACMDSADWVEAGMGSWAEKTSGSGACMSCHHEGAGGFYATGDSLQMFEINRLESMIGFFFTVRQNGIENEVVVNEDRPCGRSQGGVTHPGYVCPDEYMDKLRAFHEKTRAGLASCTAPAAFPSPPSPSP